MSVSKKKNMLNQQGQDMMDKIFAGGIFKRILLNENCCNGHYLNQLWHSLLTCICALGLNEWIDPTDVMKFHILVHQTVIVRICDCLFLVAIVLSWNIKPRGNNLTGNNLYPDERHSCQEDDNFRWDTIKRRSMIDGWMIILCRRIIEISHDNIFFRGEKTYCCSCLWRDIESNFIVTVYFRWDV